MHTVYSTLFRVRLRHSFYELEPPTEESGQSTGDFRVEPAPATRRKLEEHALLFRPLADGWAVSAEVEPDSSRRSLLRPLGTDGLRLSFLLLPQNPYLWSISNLPEYRPGRSVFYFNNLRDDQGDGRLHLGDSAAGTRVGEAYPLVAGTSFTHATPRNAATLTIEDLFGNTLDTDSFAYPDSGDSTYEYPLDLTQLERLAAGLITVREDSGGSKSFSGRPKTFYYDPEIFAARPFGVVEIFSRTDTLTPDKSERVPDAYRFLEGNTLAAVTYTLQLTSRSTTWRYRMVEKSGSKGLPLKELSIGGTTKFDRSNDHTTFTSQEEVALRESPRALVLKHKKESVRPLPNPAASTPLAKGEKRGKYISEIYINV